MPARRQLVKACCARMRSSCRGSASAQRYSVTWLALRPFYGSVRLATVAPWRALTKSCRPHALIGTSFDDLYDYAPTGGRPRRRQAKRAPVTWMVTDDWPEDMPVTDAEIDVFEAWFGDLFDDLFGKS
jgi:hypothetical protein